MGDLFQELGRSDNPAPATQARAEAVCDICHRKIIAATAPSRPPAIRVRDILEIPDWVLAGG